MADERAQDDIIRPGESFEDWLERLSRQADERCAAVRRRRREEAKQPQPERNET